MNQKIIDAIKDIANINLSTRFANVTHIYKTDGSYLTEADLAVQTQVQNLLKKDYSNVGFLGEEMTVEQQQSALEDKNGVWVLDPLDGTSNFTAGIPYYAVSLAYIKQGNIEWGMVYDPERNECFTAKRGKGAFLNEKPLVNKTTKVSIDKSTAVIDFKRLKKDLAARIASQPPYSSQRSFGGVALDWCWLAAGRYHLYLHGKQNLWDYAAGYLIFTEVGGNACTLESEPVYDFSLKPRSAVAALDGQLFEEWCKYLNI